ncbi:helix-turn-helix domain-containing protein [Rossellomorea sp. BNER]|uniref:helix-turn-helix domain-containing protein n=1 Tax=Rossellomorea sp. BNER TaxID=2962031 RepID=UPI003AF2E8D5|nr:helix-turn-helix domain-containing protein [Rossellomorea sp. BNER]
MLEGKIIKFYRKKAGLTQEQLGKGICTLSYLSKIELGQTAYSSETLVVLAERLSIDLEKEVSRLKNLETQLHRWHKAIIMQSMKEVEKINKELENIPFITSSNYAALYQLLQARYYNLKKDYEKTHAILQLVQRDYPSLPPYERNLLRHVWGIYYISNYISLRTEDHQKAIKVLKEVDIDEYGNKEYYYDLAVAYHYISSKVMAYVYAEKALLHFKGTNNPIMALNAESLMLLQIGDDVHLDLDEMEKRYQILIFDSELLYAYDKKGMLLNNLGNEYFKRKDYVTAQKFYKEAFQIADKSSVLYLQHLYSYLENCFEGKMLQKTVMLRKAQEGVSLARKLDNRLYKTIFKLLIYRVEDQLDKFYSFIEKEALPYFQLIKNSAFTNHYAKQLYNHYIEMEQYEKAGQISTFLRDDISYKHNHVCLL